MVLRTIAFRNSQKVYFSFITTLMRPHQNCNKIVIRQKDK